VALKENNMAQQKSAAPARQDTLELTLTCVDCGEVFERRGLDRAEFEARAVSQLPDREAMSLVNANVAAPINLALAANVLSDNSTAIAIAQQTAPITQGI
jgi:hypothetical protein